MTGLPDSLRIEDLYPFECCAVQTRYAPIFEHLKRGGSIEAVEVTVVDGCYLVTNGCNRVKAAKDFGLTEVPVMSRSSPPDATTMKGFVEALRLRKENGQKGFASYDIVATDDDRIRRTNNEMNLLF